jgi:hypothetical protein
MSMSFRPLYQLFESKIVQQMIDVLNHALTWNSPSETGLLNIIRL